MTPPKQPFRAVIFDFGGVLCFPPTQEQINDAAAALNLAPEIFLQEFWRDRLEYDRGRDSTEYWQTLATNAGRTLAPDQTQAFVAREIAFWSRFDTRMLSWIDDLHRAGLRTAILSNLPRPLGEHLRTIPGFLDHFDHITFSYELNSVKPEPAIYHHAVEGLQIAPREALFLDDKIENVKGAEAIGLPAHLFTTWEEFAKGGLPHHALPAPTARL